MKKNHIVRGRTPGSGPGAGGPRPGSGRKKGSGNIRMSAAEAIKMAKEGETPLAYMLRVMRQDDSDLDALVSKNLIDESDCIRLKSDREKRRDWAAQSAAPYVHPKLSSVDMKMDNDNDKADPTAALLAALDDDELEQMQQLLQTAEQRTLGRMN